MPKHFIIWVPRAVLIVIFQQMAFLFPNNFGGAKTSISVKWGESPRSGTPGYARLAEPKHAVVGLQAYGALAPKIYHLLTVVDLGGFFREKGTESPVFCEENMLNQNTVVGFEENDSTQTYSHSKRWASRSASIFVLLQKTRISVSWCDWHAICYYGLFDVHTGEWWKWTLPVTWKNQVWNAHLSTANAFETVL